MIGSYVNKFASLGNLQGCQVVYVKVVIAFYLDLEHFNYLNAHSHV